MTALQALVPDKRCENCVHWSLLRKERLLLGTCAAGEGATDRYETCGKHQAAPDGLEDLL